MEVGENMRHRGKKLAALVLCAAVAIGLVPGMMPEAKAAFDTGVLFVGGEDHLHIQRRSDNVFRCVLSSE